MECSRQPHWYTASLNRFATRIALAARSVKKLGEDDPRRIIHGLKVGLGITLVSILYTFEPLFEGYGVAAMWAVLTVVVIFEFSVGATLGKGVNRVMATVIGAMLGVGVHLVGTLVDDDDVEPFVLASFVFLLAAVVTFMRFIPELKARYDYGLMITILTFSLVVVSGYQDDEVLDQANRRMSAILVGCCAAVAICVLICPVWAGADLHNLTADNIHKLANFLQEFGDEYFKEEDNEETFREEKKESMEGFKSVLNSKNSEEVLVNYAKWEPRHGKFKYRHPWGQYQKIGDLNRQLASTVQSLNRLLHAQNQAPKEVKAKIEKACKKMSEESGLALKQISTAMKSMAHPSSTAAQAHLQKAQRAGKFLNSLSAHQGPVTHFLPAATVAMLLLDAVSISVSIAESVQELAVLAAFKVTDFEIEGDEPMLEKARSLPTDHVVTIEAEKTLVRFPTYKDPPSLDMVSQNGE